jgi:hypothetical protein
MNTTDAYYQMGKIAFILITVPPIINSANIDYEAEFELISKMFL